MSMQQHKAHHPDLDSRREARALLHEQANIASLFALEVPVADADASEPEVFD